jgi:FixJ family two-component response regulator
MVFTGQSSAICKGSAARGPGLGRGSAWFSEHPGEWPIGAGKYIVGKPEQSRIRGDSDDWRKTDSVRCRRAPGVRPALSRLLCAAGHHVLSFESAEEFLAEDDAEARGCLLLDFSLPGLSGLELQHALVNSPNALPIVFLSGTGDTQTGVQAMKKGAVDFLTKPIDGARLFAAVDEAFRRDDEQSRQGFIRRMIHERVNTLTPRERQVMDVCHSRSLK